MRQKPIGNYIVDFYCSKLKLVIEIDGESHSERTKEDKIRQRRLESLGLSFLRFYDSDVKQNLDGVLITIENWIEQFEKQYIRFLIDAKETDDVSYIPERVALQKLLHFRLTKQSLRKHCLGEGKCQRVGRKS